MVASDLEILLKAEKEAQMMIDQARSQADSIARTTEGRIKAEREKAILNFEISRKKRIQDTIESSSGKAEKIRRDGIELAKGLEGKARSRIPFAVDKVIKEVLKLRS